MAAAFYEKADYRAVKITGSDNPVEQPDNKVSYEFTVDGGSIEIKWADGTTQNHVGLKTGSKVEIDRANKTIKITEIT